MKNSWISKITSLILDMDGVLWRGNEVIGDLKSIFIRIKMMGLKVIFATNNATRTSDQYVEVLESFGINAKPDQIVTSATAAVSLLHNILPNGGPVYILGEYGLIDACVKGGYDHSETEALAVIAGMDRDLTYQKLQTATLLLRKGIPFIGTNPDVTFPTPQGLIPGAGAILAALRVASGVAPLIAGKPESTMYKVALTRLNETSDHVLAVGDRPETDITGAQQIGCYTALVLSGVTTEHQAVLCNPAPDLIMKDLETLVNLLSKNQF